MKRVDRIAHTGLYGKGRDKAIATAATAGKYKSITVAPTTQELYRAQRKVWSAIRGKRTAIRDRAMAPEILLTVFAAGRKCDPVTSTLYRGALDMMRNKPSDAAAMEDLAALHQYYREKAATERRRPASAMMITCEELKWAWGRVNEIHYHNAGGSEAQLTLPWRRKDGPAQTSRDPRQDCREWNTNLLPSGRRPMLATR